MTNPATVPILALLLTHFDTRYGARDDARHLDTYAADAFLVVGDRGVRRRDADPADVLAAWSQVERTREPQLVAPGLVAWHPDGEARGVAMVDLREANTGTPVLAAVGVVREGPGDEDWRVAWAALADGAPAPYERARMAALSELAGLRMACAAGPLTSLLEVSYLRHHHLPRTRLLALPETRFSCHGTGACCRHELTIGLDDNSVAFVEAVDWPALTEGVGAGPYTEALPAAAMSLVSFRHKLAREADGRCRFLSDDNRCTIHALAGRAVFKPCHVFPYRFAWTPDGVCVTTNAMCPTARACLGAPLAAQETELRTRLAVADVLRAEKFYLLPGQEVPWETFRTIEGQLLGLFEGDRPIRQKLWVAAKWLELRLANPEAGVDPAWYDEPIPRLGWLQRKAFDGFVRLFDPCFKDLRGVEAGETLLPEVDAELARWYRSLLFSKVTTFPYGLVAGLNYLILVQLVLERQVAKHAGRGISEAFWREFYAVVTSGTFFRLLQVCHQNPATRFARHAGVPTFGRTLLRV